MNHTRVVVLHPPPELRCRVAHPPEFRCEHAKHCHSRARAEPPTPLTLGLLASLTRSADEQMGGRAASSALPSGGQQRPALCSCAVHVVTPRMEIGNAHAAANRRRVPVPDEWIYSNSIGTGTGGYTYYSRVRLIQSESENSLRNRISSNLRKKIRPVISH